MSIDKEAETLENLRAEAECGQIVGAFAIREQVERTLSKKVSEDYLYDLLHRHGWRKVVPRPKHPKTNQEKQEEFKKNSRRWWEPLPLKVSHLKTKDR